MNSPFETTTDWQMAVACNSHENGSFSGKSDSFNFVRGGEDLTLEGPDLDFIWVESIEGQSQVLIDDEIFECNRIRKWVGNWCWDSCHISNYDFLRILTLLATKGYGPTMGNVELFSFYESISERASNANE